MNLGNWGSIVFKYLEVAEHSFQVPSCMCRVRSLN